MSKIKLNLPLQLILLFTLLLLGGDYLPISVKSGLYTLSLNIKDILQSLLPIIIFGCLFLTIIEQRGRAIQFVVGLVLIVSFSNLISTLVGYYFGRFGLEFLGPKIYLNHGPALIKLNILKPLLFQKVTLDMASSGLALLLGFNFILRQVKSKPKFHFLHFWLITFFILLSFCLVLAKPLLGLNLMAKKNWQMSNGAALGMALTLGLIFSAFPNDSARRFAEDLNQWVGFFLKKIFVPTLPFFALGFLVKMQHEGTLALAFKSYLPLFLLVFFADCIYIVGLFLFAAKGHFKRCYHYLVNALPAGLVGFTTLSSLAAMQLTIEATEKNTGTKDFAKAIVPATVNVHMIGSSIAIPILALYIFKAEGLGLPSFLHYLNFAQYFVLAKFTVAAVPCGSIIVMTPLLEQYLGFSAPMSGLITTLYLLFNPLSAASNVLGNSAFAILISKFYQKKTKTPMNFFTKNALELNP